MMGMWSGSAGLRGTLGVLLAVILLWEGAVWLLKPPLIILPPPSRIWVDFIEAPNYFLRHSWYTLSTTLAGFALSVVLGVGLAVAIVNSRLMERIIYTLLVALNSLPKVALAPLFVIWMGTGVEPKIAIAVMLAIFSIVVDTVLGLRSVDPDAIALARVNHASPLKILIKIRFPNALPSLFVGMKIAISFAPSSRCPTRARPSGTSRTRRGSSRPSCWRRSRPATGPSTGLSRRSCSTPTTRRGRRHPRPSAAC
jgi:NitT/TauT family transport system permease protein